MRCRIRTSPAQRLLTAPRGFSQPATSFIGSWRQGIPRTPFVAPRLCSRSDAPHAGSLYSTCSAVVKVLLERPRPDRARSARRLLEPRHPTTTPVVLRPRRSTNPSGRTPRQQKTGPALTRGPVAPNECACLRPLMPQRHAHSTPLGTRARAPLQYTAWSPAQPPGPRVELGRFELPTSRVQGGRSPTKLQPRTSPQLSAVSCQPYDATQLPRTHPAHRTDG